MIHFNIIISILAIVWLLLCSLQDIRNKKINIILIISGFLVLSISSVICGEVSLLSRLAGLSLGLLLLGLHPITRGQIGIGDGLIVCTTGLCFGFSQNAILLVYALFAAAIVSMILILFFRANRKNTIPFIPFLLLGYVGVLFI
jgi:leader peptidase (prepilin peptidase)/N-methyltransferase